MQATSIISFFDNHDSTPISPPHQLCQAPLKNERKHREFLKHKKLAIIQRRADQLMIKQLARKAKG